MSYAGAQEESLESHVKDLVLKKEIGKGSHATVYQAVWNGREVAAKRIHSVFFSHQEMADQYMEEFQREWDVLKLLDHPNVVKLHAVLLPKGHSPIIITELLHCDLENYIKESTTSPKIPEMNLICIALDVIEGLIYMHGLDPPVVHRNLANRNILLSVNGNAKIADLGVAKGFAAGCDMYATRFPVTTVYTAPETYPVMSQFEVIDDANYGPKVDVFSFGVVLMTMILGHGPTITEDGEVISEHVRRRTDISEMGDHYLKELVLGCLENNSKQRPDFKDIKVELERVKCKVVLQSNPCGADEEIVDQVVPSEINLRGRLALEAYNKALTEGKVCVKRVPVMLIGQDHSGKTSLKNSLMGKPFNCDEDSTLGIDVDPSHFKVTTEIWKTGENDQATLAEEAISYEHYAARLVAEHLKEENNIFKSMESENIPLVDAASSYVSSDVSRSSNSSSETSRGATESVQTSTVIPDSSSDPNQRSKEHSPHALPKIPEEVATLIKKLLQEVEKVEDEEDIYSVLWDFGGQSVYHATHPLFITARAMYVLIYDLSRDPHERAEPIVKQGMFKKMLDNHDMKTNLDYLNFWMTSVASLASQDQQVRSDPAHVNIPPVFLVCTHADVPYDGADPSELAREVFGSLQTKPYKNQLNEDVFVVDNTKSGTESECSEVTRLREKVLDVAKELPQMKEVIPIKWLKYEKALQVSAKEGHKWISIEIAKQIATGVCKIDDDQEFLTLLNFLHDQRIVVHFDDTPVLHNLVILDPQWLVNVFKEVITVKPYDPQEIEYKELWHRLQSKGILEEKLLEHVWGPLLENQETSTGLIEIMEKFSLLCEWPSSNASCGKRYLVPSALMSHPSQDIIELVGSAQIPSLFLKFEFGQVPPGLFPRLVLQFFQWGQDEFWSSENPQLYLNFAQFYTSGDADCSVILWCHSSSIEIVVHREDRLDLAESLQSKINISADAHYDAFEVACACAVRRQLGLMLECIRKEFCWLKNMKYEEGFICSVCCQGRVVKYCCDHHRKGCEQEECLHFWSVSDLRSAKQFVRCRKCPTAQSKIHIKQFAPWIETADEQPTTDEHDGRLPAPVGGNDETLVALPSQALKSLFSQPCDSKEVVLQLTNCLQLDQASLEQPDPRTKRLIRCLATRAKQSNRLDVVKHLREITPAGTTGPLLPEYLDIRNIPVRQVTDLTVELSGGEEWKVVAEELGLTPQEIRFIDKRTLNPCEAVLAFSAKNRYISVGCLYDMLTKCALPMTADRL